MSAAALVVEGACLRDGKRVLLGPVDLSLPGTGMTVVMGANGAGKSLFLKMAHGLLSPAEGRVLWGGELAAETVRRRGFVFQTPPVLRRSVLANVAFPLQAEGVPRRVRQARAREALARVRLAEKAGLPAARLSGGERQRMALARALIGAPTALLLDEPSASLDPASTAALEALISEVAGDGVKVLMTTHDIGQARRLAADVVFFAAGHLAETGPAEAFFARPRSEAAQAYLEGRL
ncbi:MAG: ATP-binding cassette domain-containing protein [Pseudomonadota bacterium]